MTGESQSFDLVGPTVDDDIRRAINRYGAQAVKDAVKRLTSVKAKRGRKPIKDWPELASVWKADAKIWLEGGDPFAKRANYSIAQDYAAQNPGQSSEATFRRIMRKLAKSRVATTLMYAFPIGETEYPYKAHLKTLRTLAELRGQHEDLWVKLLEDAERYIDEYTQKFGPIPENMTMKEVEMRSKNPLLATAFPSILSTSPLLATMHRAP